MIGVALQQKPWLHVLEFLQYGDLRAVLEACKEKKIELTLAEQLHWGMQLCAGCEYMASKVNKLSHICSLHMCSEWFTWTWQPVTVCLALITLSKSVTSVW